MPLTKELDVVLVGNPNSGKTSLFNRLTGLNQQVGNFPGVTVDKKSGSCSLPNSAKAKITDLPGAYSLYPNSEDEKIVLQQLFQAEGDRLPDAVIYTADATNLERHFLLLTQVIDLGLPVILAINMLDVANKDGMLIDGEYIQQQLGIKVVRINARTGEGVGELKQELLEVKKSNTGFIDIEEIAGETISAVQDKFAYTTRYKALLAAHHGTTLKCFSEEEIGFLEQVSKKSGFNSIRAQVTETLNRFKKIQLIVAEAVKKSRGEEEHSLTDKVDSLLTHKVIGTVIFGALLFLVFQAIFAWASVPMDLIDEGTVALSEWVQNTLPDSMFTSLLVDGIIAGLGGIIIFVPQITILFLLISLLEEVGYMSRAVFLSDGLMRRFGLNGRSIIALISGAACAIPAVMSTRTISNYKERLITIMVTPLISCSARIPVYALLVAFVVPEDSSVWIFNSQGLVVMGLYALGTGSAIFAAWVMKQIVKTEESSFFVMELPAYKMPHWKNVFLTVFEKVKVFVFEAGKIIFVISIILWFAASFGPADSMEQAEAQAQIALEEGTVSQEDYSNVLASKKLEASYAGVFGKFIEPAIRPLGFDWKVGIALVTSFAAREVFVGTMATIYSVGSDEEEKPILDKMRSEVRPDGSKVYTRASALSLLVFYVFAMQCMSTLAIVKRETKSWKWPTIQLVYMTALAYFSSLIVFQLFS
ncbi:ferrous iron transport protein B [Flammeovirgaceae bacterium SG7u.111]|nr:ferrous iron transport protein B [Flammeovirgaceae bacterium SG7u.132]WPO34152.1 ferrous iron transport protein B [Flammeovirgaceae bacterium SG7u.111]